MPATSYIDLFYKNHIMKTKLFLSITMCIVSFCAFAQDATGIRKKHFNLTDDGIAIKGYDPVAYFTKGEAIKGKKEFAVFHQGATYYFSSSENKEAFKKNPSVYEPQYGGWCAYAMGEKGEKVSIDPETFKIINGKLYLFYNRFFNNTLKSWNKDEPNLKHNADANWQSIFH
jgi:YHS domain-containing protein